LFASKGATQDKAIEQVDTTDKARAAFVRQYLGLEWPELHLYHAMFNTEMGRLVQLRYLLSVSNSSSVTLSDVNGQSDGVMAAVWFAMTIRLREESVA
jgi:hypothetical protein